MLTATGKQETKHLRESTSLESPKYLPCAFNLASSLRKLFCDKQHLFSVRVLDSSLGTNLCECQVMPIPTAEKLKGGRQFPFL